MVLSWMDGLKRCKTMSHNELINTIDAWISPGVGVPTGGACTTNQVVQVISIENTKLFEGANDG